MLLVIHIWGKDSSLLFFEASESVELKRILSVQSRLQKHLTTCYDLQLLNVNRNFSRLRGAGEEVRQWLIHNPYFHIFCVC